MIERKLRRTTRGVPGRIGRIISRLSLNAPIKHPGEDYANRVTAWVAAGISERPDLVEMNVSETGFFKEFPGRGIFQRLINVHESARESPLALEWFAGPLDQQHLDAAAVAIKQGYVDRQSRARIIVAVGVPGIGFRICHAASFASGDLFQFTLKDPEVFGSK